MNFEFRAPSPMFKEALRLESPSFMDETRLDCISPLRFFTSTPPLWSPTKSIIQSEWSPTKAIMEELEQMPSQFTENTFTDQVKTGIIPLKPEVVKAGENEFIDTQKTLTEEINENNWKIKFESKGGAFAKFNDNNNYNNNNNIISSVNNNRSEFIKFDEKAIDNNKPKINLGGSFSKFENKPINNNNNNIFNKPTIKIENNNTPITNNNNNNNNNFNYNSLNPSKPTTFTSSFSSYQNLAMGDNSFIKFQNMPFTSQNPNMNLFENNNKNNNNNSFITNNPFVNPNHLSFNNNNNNNNNNLQNINVLPISNKPNFQHNFSSVPSNPKSEKINAKKEDFEEPPPSKKPRKKISATNNKNSANTKNRNKKKSPNKKEASTPSKSIKPKFNTELTATRLQSLQQKRSQDTQSPTFTDDGHLKNRVKEKKEVPDKIQCLGSSKKKGTQCKNAALLEYIGPRPLYCAEHIEEDKNTIHGKCKCSYFKEKGDGKPCKQIVLKELVMCYLHFNEVLLTLTLEKARKQKTLVVEMIKKLRQDSKTFLKTNMDLYQRKSKLLPKYIQLENVISKFISEKEKEENNEPL